MKAVILFAVAALVSVQSFAASKAPAKKAAPAPEYADCRKTETDLQCANRVILKSAKLTQNFYTGSEKEWPMLFPAIFATKPSAAHLMSRSGEGESIMSDYLVIYPVSASDISGLRAAAFTVEVEAQVEDTGGAQPKIVGRSVKLDSITLVGGDIEE